MAQLISRRRHRVGFQVAILLLSCILTSCVLFRAPKRQYASNAMLLSAVAEEAGYTVAPQEFELVAVDLRDDALTFQYRGLRYPGDQAWVIRFGQKSTEQDGAGLTAVYGFADVLAEGRDEFEIVAEETHELADGVARVVTYTFHSPVRDEAGKPFVAHGIFATWRHEELDGPVVYHVKLDNYGDRERVAWPDLQPFWRPVLDTP